MLHSKSGCKCGEQLKYIFAATSRLVFEQTNGHHSLAELTHRMNHHTVKAQGAVALKGAAPISLSLGEESTS